MVRSVPSGMASICVIARFQAPGMTNSTRPSSTATRHSAAHRSLTSTSRSAVAAHVLQERVVALQHHHGIATLERPAVGVKAALEGEERRIAAGRLAEDAGGFGIAFASQLLRVALGLRSEERRVGKECRARGAPKH